MDEQIVVELETDYLPKSEYVVKCEGFYIDNSPKFTIFDFNGMPQVTITVNLFDEATLCDMGLADRTQVWVKNWSENKGILRACITAQLLKSPHEAMTLNYGNTACLCRLGTLRKLMIGRPA